MKKILWSFIFICILGWSALSQCTTVTYSVNPGIFPEEISFSLLDSAGATLFTSTPFNSNVSISGTWCLPNGCYTVQMMDSFGDGWNNGTLDITTADGEQYQGTLATGGIGMFYFGVGVECGNTVSVGCMDPNAVNFDPSANVSGPCDYSGCTDPSATNFNPNATIPDSSCVYCNGVGSVNAQLYICTFSNGNEVTLNIVNSAGDTIFTSPSLGNVAIYYTSICLQAGECYTALMSNNAGNNGWYNGYFWVNNGSGQVIHTGLANNLNWDSANFSMDGTCGEIFGCTDPLAVNFNPDATASDNSCTYIYGCNDSLALNYNPAATMNDGSCIYTCEGELIHIYPSNSTNGSWMNIQDITTGYYSNLNMYGFDNYYFCASPNCYTIYYYGSVDSSGASTAATFEDENGNTWNIPANQNVYWSLVEGPCAGMDIDNDGDGATANIDCNDNDFMISPYMNEIVGDNVDNDCDGEVDETGQGCFAEIMLVPDSLVTNPYEIWVYMPPTEDNFMSYEWYFGDSLGGYSNEAYPSYVYPNTGTYTLCLSTYDSTGCWGYNCITFNMDELGNGGPGGAMTQPFTLNIINTWPQGTSTQVEEIDSALGVYPNPAQDEVRIQLPHDTNGTLTIWSVDGKKVLTTNTNSGLKTLNVSEWPQGIYMVEWQHCGARWTERLIIE